MTVKLSCLPVSTRWLAGLVLALLSVAPKDASASLVRPRTLDELFKGATVVASARIKEYKTMSHDGKVCGTRYRAKVIATFKDVSGSVKDGYIVFGRSSGLPVGSDYLLFLNYRDDPEKIYDEVERSYNELEEHAAIEEPKAKILDLIRCNGLVPGLLFSEDAAWHIEDGAVYFEGLLPSPVPSSIHVRTLPSKIQWYLRAADIFAYLRGLGQ